MQELQFLNRLIANEMAINPARVLLFISDNPNCQQKDMLGPLRINRSILSQCCRMLMHKRLIIQSGPYTAKKHELTDKGKELVSFIKNEKVKPNLVETDFTENDAIFS